MCAYRVILWNSVYVTDYLYGLLYSYKVDTYSNLNTPPLTLWKGRVLVFKLLTVSMFKGNSHQIFAFSDESSRGRSTHWTAVTQNIRAIGEGEPF